MVFPLASFVPAALLAVSNAALEEVAYRGALMGWGALTIGPRGALILQAVVFGLSHWGPDVRAGAWVIFAGLAAAGLVLGLVARRSGSLLLPFAVHAAVDIPLYHALACRLG
jgi:membrane protease YdiL (CAAX protease family)